MGGSFMLLFTMLCQLVPEAMIRFFSSDPEVIAVGGEYLRIATWGGLASSVIYVNGSLFQAMGNTIPPLVASITRILIVAIPAVLMARMAGFELRWLWWLSVAATMLQLGINLVLLRREFRARLRFEAVPAN